MSPAILAKADRFEEALDGLRNQLSSFQGYAERNPVVGRNMLLVTQARIEWLEETLKTMKH